MGEAGHENESIMTSLGSLLKQVEELSEKELGILVTLSARYVNSGGYECLELENLIQKADVAMYKSKKSGKNQFSEYSKKDG